MRQTQRRVGELADATGLTVPTLHHYEQIGLLTDIGRALDDPAWDLAASLQRHLADLDGRIEASQRLRARVDAESGAGPPVAERLVGVLGGMSELDRPEFFQRRIASMVYADLEATYRFLVDVFGLGAGPWTRDHDGVVVHAEVRAGDRVIWLHPERAEHGLASPGRRAVEHGAHVDYPPVDQPYGYRECSSRDPEGGLWSFMKPLEDDDPSPSTHAQERP